MTHTDAPTEVHRTLQEAANALNRANQITATMPALDQRLAEAEKRFTEAKTWLLSVQQQHREAGQQITAELASYERFREMVELFCTKHGYPVPATPDETVLPAAEPVAGATGSTPIPTTDPLTAPGPVVASTPCFQGDPPQHGDCTGDACICGCHAAEAAAIAEERQRVEDALTTRTDTIPTANAGGGGVPGNGRFQHGGEVLDA